MGSAKDELFSIAPELAVPFAELKREIDLLIATSGMAKVIAEAGFKLHNGVGILRSTQSATAKVKALESEIQVLRALVNGQNNGSPKVIKDERTVKPQQTVKK
jgi:hypothetical protein